MNDLDRIRAFREDLSRPDPDRVAAGRTRLLEEAMAGDGTRGGASRRRVAAPRVRVPRPAAVAVAAALATGAAGSAAVLWADSPPPPVSTRPVSATVFLERAAATAEREPDRRPADDQWVYIKVYSAEAGPPAPEGARHREDWVRFDGLRTARYERVGGEPRLRVRTMDPASYENDSEERTPAQWYDYLRGLPREPAALLDAVQRRFAEYERETGAVLTQGRDQWVFGRLSQFLAQEPALPPSARAAVFRAMGALDGVRVRRDARDALGRAGVAVARTGNDGIRTEVVLAPGSYEYLGSRVVATGEQRVRNSPGDGDAPGTPRAPDPAPAGRVVMDRALEASGIVDEPGVRP